MAAGVAIARVTIILRQMSLERFHEAQATRAAGYDTALAEIRAGGKRSHWIWYIFPQIEGFGQSSIARTYALRDLGEACAYLRDPILRARYEEIVAAVCEQLARGIRVDDLMDSQIDALKLVSSLTLFRAAAEQLGREDSVYASLAACLSALLERTTKQGYPACELTLARIAGEPPKE
jgi:uncharacterized protein (DUF1810 family)